jgi:hypothetical protein
LRGVARVAYKRFGMAPDSWVKLRTLGRQHVSGCPSNDPSNDKNSGVLVLTEDILPKLTIVRKYKYALILYERLL